MTFPFPDLDEVRALRQSNYNATLTELRICSDELAVFRIRPDSPKVNWTPGQFATLGLGAWEPRVPGTQPETLDQLHSKQLIRRAYSISAPILDSRDRVLVPQSDPVLEFYITLVRHGGKTPPALTPRLFCLKPGDRLFIADKIAGHYTLAPVSAGQAVLMFATGTGEAPHNAMIAELFARGHSGPIVSAVCVRNRRELGYLPLHRRLEKLFPNYHYLTATTREPENLDPSVPGYLGKMYLQDLIRNGVVDRVLGRRFEPEHTHAFLCGNPQMIGIPESDPQGLAVFPKPTGMVELLVERGFHCGDRHTAGNIHFEKYW